MSAPATEALLEGSALTLAAAIAAGELSASAAVELHLARIAEVNPRLNAIVTLCEDDARAVAAAADSEPHRGPLHGVPFVAKDVLATAGIRSAAGSLLLREYVPTRDATAVARLRAAGAILLGKSNCPEFALDPYTDNRLFGQTLNPRDETVTVGGSSGGDAAAVASGCAAFGLGSDYGGSLRWPAQCTGLVGLRPTVGLVPMTGTLPFAPGEEWPAPSSVALLSRLQTLGPLARSVDDCWAVLQAIAGPDGVDPNCVPVRLGDPQAVDVSMLACAWMDGEGTEAVDPDLVAAVERAAHALAGTGMTVVRQRPPGLEQAVEIYRAYRLADGLPVHAAVARGREQELGETMAGWFETLRPEVSVAEYQAIASRRDALRARVLAFMEEYPVLLAPVSLGPAWKVGSAAFAERLRTMAPCWAITVLGLPSLSVPCGQTHDGRGASVQVVGRPFHDHEVVAVANALVAALSASTPHG